MAYNTSLSLLLFRRHKWPTLTRVYTVVEAASNCPSPQRCGRPQPPSPHTDLLALGAGPPYTAVSASSAAIIFNTAFELWHNPLGNLEDRNRGLCSFLLGFERERERERERDRETERQRETETETERQTERQRYTHTDPIHKRGSVGVGVGGGRPKDVLLQWLTLSLFPIFLTHITASA